MGRYFVRTGTAVGAALLAISLMAEPAVAAQKQAVSRVTDYYKTWLQDEGRTVTGRVRILLKPDRIFVQIAHDQGTSRLVFTPDGNDFLGEYTLKARERDSDRCLLRVLCGNDKDSDNAGTMTAVAFKPPATRPGRDKDDDRPTAAAASSSAPAEADQPDTGAAHDKPAKDADKPGEDKANDKDKAKDEPKDGKDKRPDKEDKADKPEPSAKAKSDKAKGKPKHRNTGGE